MLLPHSWWQMVATDIQHQYVAVYAGGVFGVMTLVGAFLLFKRRVFNARIRAVSRSRDVFVIAWIMLTAALGLSTIPESYFHAQAGDVSVMLSLTEYVKSIATLSVDPSLLAGVPYTYKLHMLFGMTIFLVFPFTRLVHVWSVPLTYLIRPYQIVRAKRMKTN